MVTRSEQIFVNLPVKDLQASIAFFTKLGYEFNPKFTDENATQMIIGKNISAMLLKEDFFQTFHKNALADTTKVREVLITITLESREAVDELVDLALSLGAEIAAEPQEYEYMYSKSFLDLDKHLWEILYFNEDAFE
ncbi:glyoxalase/bleomycin resistance/extradiol dioxygenase family protein [Listeria sp. FSL L7-1485]|uniref:Glyoxalase/bleomycin resistance/extradiol dioxygenase family protein n=1 Tax=Listeria immobilis TaxID=2713502 RepID=A0A7X0X621_9LIST|nr:VOC family protein [Listeria immobilis]MBC1482537.1 glyoxalase/bleomycin resistance/extradiol dioxygenase family protein [Listeria immobilis]MBC1488204.1 glyoxalase/bleomycin resistance/extradiol dioxygenase family protein [Listeria immobilis]MBC1507870.1 glyoxalase/bleomycin resistance/extradiol dioxygenase family protein [Listeria immobilis]MBC1509799.1 glyoxalase/bleomycin resistance/extradiol dioxygenase family protein [Listeria immobilis]MBC1516969.1 glyoxalase/bleomycin resistance/ext